MRRFCIEDYYNTDNVVMHCPTEEQAVAFLGYLHDIGRHWCDGESYNNCTKYEVYRENTVYYFNEGRFGNIRYTRGLILEFEDFDWSEDDIEDSDDLTDFLNNFI